MNNKNSYPFYIGTYTNQNSEGIYKYLLNADGTLELTCLSAHSNNPSFLTKSLDEKYLVAVNEIDYNGVGFVESFLIESDSLKFISKSSSGGANPCFVSINELGFVLVANYTGGNIGLLKLNENGELSALLDLEVHTGKGTTDRQDKPHAHSAWFENYSEKIISADLGTNELWFSSIDTAEQKLIPSLPHKVEMNPGAGPRHLAFHPNRKWIYVVNELDCTITLIKKIEENKYILGNSISTLPEGYTEFNTCADIHISSDGKFVYASNRGHNSIAIYSVNLDDGSLSLLGFEPTFGDCPRNFSLSPDEKHLVVANQNTNNLVSFKRDINNGLLEYCNQIMTPNPVCILF